MPLEGGSSRTTIAYLAGLFDGEGSISASPSPKSPNNYRIDITLAMCDIEGVELFAAVFGGKIRKQKRLTNAGRQVYVCSFFCKQAAEVLQLMMPYLRIKRGRAENAVTLATMMDRANAARVREGGQIVDLEARHALGAEIRAANIANNGRLRRHAIS